MASKLETIRDRLGAADNSSVGRNFVHLDPGALAQHRCIGSMEWRYLYAASYDDLALLLAFVDGVRELRDQFGHDEVSKCVNVDSAGNTYEVSCSTVCKRCKLDALFKLLEKEE